MLTLSTVTVYPKSSQYIVEYLKSLKIRAVFGVGGANIEDLYDALFHQGEGIQAVVAKHEFSAGTMADAYSRFTGGLGVVMATSGGGAFNLVPALCESLASAVPILAIVGQVPTEQEGQGGFQDSSGRGGSVDAEKIFQGASKFCRSVRTAEELPAALQDAVASALSHPQGPAVLLIPKDIMCAPQKVLRTFWLSPASFVSSQAVPEAAALLSSKRTLIICGEGVTRTNSQSLVAQIAEQLDASVAVTASGKSAFDHQSPRFVGVTGVMGHTSVIESLKSAEACLLIGTRMAVMNRFGLDDLLARTPVISVGPQNHFLRPQPSNFSIEGDISPNLKALIEALKTATAPDLPKAPQPHFTPQTLKPTYLGPKNPAFSSMDEFMHLLQEELEPQSNILCDAGNVGASAVHYLRLPSKTQFCIALGMGGMGYSFGAAIGAALANSKRTYVIAGDGAFFMHGSEIHTSVELNLPITYLIFNNNAHAMCITREVLLYNTACSYNRFKPVNLSAGMGAMFANLPTFGVRRPEKFRTALQQIKSLQGPAFISIETDPDEIPPFISFLEKA
ncbi:thiamine pyrophosphate-binding protein [Bdellovibrionota bacterium FG-1]